MSKIKELLKKSGITQASLAKKLGISRQQLYSILKDNRKTKYTNKITGVLNEELSNSEVLSSDSFNNRANTGIEKLPIIHCEDILKVVDGTVSLDSFYKPYYNQWSFISTNISNRNHFCLRIADMLNFKNEMVLVVFRLFLSLSLEDGKYFLVYQSANKKVIAGSLKLTSDKRVKYIINNSGSYQVSKNDLFLAEGTQLVCYL